MKLEFLADGSPDCPLIRIFSFSTTEALEFRSCLEKLGNGSLSEIRLHEQRFIEPIGNCELLLFTGKCDAGVHQRSSHRFDWESKASSWEDMAMLVTPLISLRSNKYQWLCNRGRIKVLLSTDGNW